MLTTITEDTSRIAEKLLALSEHGALLLKRIYNVKMSCATSSTVPPALINKKLREAVVPLMKHFPKYEFKKLVQKEDLLFKGEEIQKQLQYHYAQLNAALEFKTETMKVLSFVCTNLKGLSLTSHFDIVTTFF